VNGNSTIEPQKVKGMNDAPQDDDDIPSEIDFSGATRGKFYRAGVTLKLPIHLDPEVRAYLSALAARKGVDLSDLINELLKKAIAIIESGK
jgi:hypothetical protein